MKTVYERCVSPLSRSQMLIIMGTSVCFSVTAVIHVVSIMLYAFFFGLTGMFCPSEKYGAVDFCRGFLLSLGCGIPSTAFALWIAFPEIWFKRFTDSLMQGGLFLALGILCALLYRFFEQWWRHRYDHKDKHFPV